jgi:hypothetical protein
VTIKILNVAGHLRCADITEDGLCDGLDKAASAAKLRVSTGTSGEVQYTSDMATRLKDKLNATGRFESRAIDCVYRRDDFLTWKPDLVIAHHYHRDPNGRAMFSAPDNQYKYHTDASNAESIRLVARILGNYWKATGIPVTQDLVSLNMRDLYTWCYIDPLSQAFIAEYGNANVDADALYNRTDDIANYIVACLLEHFNIVATLPAPGPTPRPLASIAADLDKLSAELRARQY